MNLKLLTLGAAVTLGLSGCLGSGSDSSSSITQSLAAGWLDNECHNYVNEQQVWQVAKLTMNSDKAQTIENELCGCASNEAAKNMTTDQMIGLASETTRNQVLVEMIAPTVTSCYSRLQGVF